MDDDAVIQGDVLVVDCTEGALRRQLEVEEQVRQAAAAEAAVQARKAEAAAWELERQKKVPAARAILASNPQLALVLEALGLSLDP